MKNLRLQPVPTRLFARAFSRLRRSTRSAALLTVFTAALPVCILLNPGTAAAQAAGTDPCDTAQTTAAMRSCADTEYRKADAELNRAYQDALKAEDAAGKRNLIAAETAWLKFRDAEALYQAGKAAGGTLAPLLRVSALTQLTQARLAQLKAAHTKP